MPKRWLPLRIVVTIAQDDGAARVAVTVEARH
jgi:hypothetical protein